MWSLRPEEVLQLPTGLAGVDALLDDLAFFCAAIAASDRLPFRLADGAPARRSSMVDVQRSQADAEGTVYSYLGVKISGTDVWTTGHDSPSRCLGELKGARASMIEPRRSWIGTFISSLLLGEAPPKGARLCITFADGTRYERLMLPWVNLEEWPRIAGQIGRFNAAAYLATRL